MKQGNQRIIPFVPSTWSVESLLRFGIQIGTFLILLTPLVIYGETAYPTIFPKAIYFRVLAEFIFLLYILLVLQNKRYLPKITPVFLSVLFFIEILAFAAWRGINPLLSVFGSIERMEGFILFAHLFLFYVVLVGVFRHTSSWLWFVRWIVFISIPIGIAGIIQKFSTVDFFSGPDVRVSATFGNPIFYAAALLFFIFFAMFLGIHEKKMKWRLLYGGLTLFNTFMLILTGTRGAWIGFAIGVFVLILFWYFVGTRRNESLRRVLLFGIFLFVLFFMLFLVLSDLEYIPETVFLDRYQGLWDEIVDPESSRTFVWQLGIEAWKNSPLIGYGQESFSYLYDSYYKASFLLSIFPRTCILTVLIIR